MEFVPYWRLYHMRGATNQSKILASLLESSKTTAELAKEMGYVNSMGIARYNIIYNDLKRLEKNGYIKSKKEKLDNQQGNTPTMYSIFYKIQNLKRILEEFPNLIENIQSSELSLEIIVQENFSWVSKSAEVEYEQIENLNLYEISGKESWKEKLKFSKEFLRFCLSNDLSDMIEKVKKLAQISNEYLGTNHRIDIIFKVCIASDILLGQAKDEAIEYLEQRKNAIFGKEYKQLREYYNNTKFAPDFIRGKEFTKVENPKIREIENEFLEKGGKLVSSSNFIDDVDGITLGSV